MLLPVSELHVLIGGNVNLPPLLRARDYDSLFENDHKRVREKTVSSTVVRELG